MKNNKPTSAESFFSKIDTSSIDASGRFDEMASMLEKSHVRNVGIFYVNGQMVWSSYPAGLSAAALNGHLYGMGAAVSDNIPHMVVIKLESSQCIGMDRSLTAFSSKQGPVAAAPLFAFWDGVKNPTEPH